MVSSSAPVEPGAVLRSPDEPPGLDRVRRWLAKPIAAVRFVWLWVRWIGIHLGRGMRVVGRSAYHGARIAQAAGAVAASVGKVGNRLDGMGQNWSRAGGRLGRVGGRLANAGRRMREGGSRWASTARGAAGVGVAVGELHEAITGEAPEGEKPVIEEPAPESHDRLAEPGQAVPSAPERGSAVSPRPVVPESVEKAAPGSPAEPSPVSRSEPKGRRRSKRVNVRSKRSAADPVGPDSDPARGTPAAGAAKPGQQARRSSSAGADSSPGSPPEASQSGTPPEASSPGDPAPTAASTTPPEAPPAGDRRPRPAAAQPDRSPDRLPDDLREAVRSLGKRPRSKDLRAVIVRLCAGRWTTARELAAYLGNDERNLRRRHLDPMADAGRLERRRPAGARKTHREYRAIEPGPG